MATSRLQQALERGIQPGAELADELYALGDYPIHTEEDARAVLDALNELAIPSPPSEVERALTPLLWLFQDADTEEAVTVFAEEGIPIATRHYDAMIDEAEAPERVEALLFILKLLAMYRDEGLVERIAAAARSRFAAESYEWSEILECLDGDHPLGPEVIDVLREHLPRGQFGLAYLDLANSRALEGELDTHPFDTSAGKAMLCRWMRCKDPEEHGYPRSVTASIPYISDPQRTQLLALAMDHPDATVQREAAWASARLGSEGGVKILARFCREVNHCAIASEYLRELGREEAIPPEARAPEHLAKAELSRWLAHPSELGAAPDEIEVVDTRELYWPPTDDRRRLWILRYIYHAEEEDEMMHTGIGLVGSMTFALEIDTLEERTAEEIYGLHCCLELQCAQDDRAPEQLDAAYGWRLIRGQVR